MDYTLLRLWLGLSPGPWPPDHYSLLGLTSGPSNSESIEELVLARMDSLRPHQILHPELVTEGMNRLAQALICLTDAAAKAIYDAEHGLAKSKPQVASERDEQKGATDPIGGSTTRSNHQDQPSVLIPIEEDEPIGTDVTQVIDVRYEPGLVPPEPLPPAYEVVVEEVVGSFPPAFEIIEDQEWSIRRADNEVIGAKLISRPAPLWQPPNRRAIFSRITAIRRLLAQWQKLKPLLGNPREPIDRPVTVLILLEAASEVGPLLDALPGVAGTSDEPGGLIAALIRQPLSLHTIRSLLPDQRRAVAADWQLAEESLVRESYRLRELVRSGRPFRLRYRNGTRLWRLTRSVVEAPESILVVIILSIAFAALVRSLSQR